MLTKEITMYKVLTAPSIAILERLMDAFTVTRLGSLLISHGQYYQSFLGVPKEVPVPKPDPIPVPKPAAKRKATTKRKPTTTTTT